MKKALICLEQLGIGGVETFTITQVEEFARRNIKCYVLAREGLLSEKIKQLKNIEFVEFDFKLENKIDEEKINWLINFVEEKKIDFIYVHQFPCILYILPVVFKTKIPYIAYLHNIVPKTCEWFMEHYDMFKVLFPVYFECASKIIAITDAVKEEHQKLFNIPENRYIVINNSLDFSKYPNKKIDKLDYPYNKFLLFGRVSEQKRTSIETAVKFYEYCKEKYNPNITLTVVGDGEIFEEITEKYKDKNINFKGAVSDMAPEIENADVLLGVDRCMLEAVASKKPAVVCGYKGNVVLITPKNIKDAIKENFTGINLKDDKDELFKYSEKELIKILNDNYEYVSKKLAITDSVYLDIAPFEVRSDLFSVFEGLNYYIEKIKDLEQENHKLYLSNQELYKNIDCKTAENKELLNKINSILESKRYKFINRSADLVNTVLRRK